MIKMFNLSAGLDLDLKNICRLCLEKANESTDLFCESADSIEILKKISDCFQIILSSEKYLPCVICKKCIEELNNANKLRIKCVTINERFKDFCENLLKISSVKSNKEQICKANDDTSSIGNDVNSESESFFMVTNKESHFICDICNKTLKSKQSLERHILCMHEKRRHVGRVTGYGAARRYHCTTCSYATPHSQTLVNHMRRHNGDRPFSCECGKNFTQASSLAAHKKTHSAMTFFTCTECGKQFKHAFALKTHLRVHENGKFICNVCTKALKSKESLHSHIKRHYKVFDYNCEDCGDTFVTSAELNSHKQKHNTNKNIKCHICDYSTNTRKSLVVHLKRQVGDKPFRCNFCDNSFCMQSELRRHMRVHTRDKPFSCQMCAQKFTYSTSLNKHMQTVHGIQYKWGDVKWKEARMKKRTSKCAF